MQKYKIKLNVEKTYPATSWHPSKEGTLPHPDNSQFPTLNSHFPSSCTSRTDSRDSRSNGMI